VHPTHRWLPALEAFLGEEPFPHDLFAYPAPEFRERVPRLLQLPQERALIREGGPQQLQALLDLVVGRPQALFRGCLPDEFLVDERVDCGGAVPRDQSGDHLGPAKGGSVDEKHRWIGDVDPDFLERLGRA
jgi:hypothetical protein